MKRLFVFLGMLLTTFGTQAQHLEKGLLWKISGKEIKQPSYLFGTVHITCNAIIDENVVSALNATRQLYLEVDMDDPALPSKMMSGILMKDGNKISAMASAEDYALLDTFLTEKLSMPLALADRFKPALLSMMLTNVVLDCQPQSYEQELMQVAKANNEEIYGLESIADQMAVFDEIPYDKQLEELIKMAKGNLAKEKEDFIKLLEVYNSKDLNKIMKLVKEQDSEITGNEDIMLNDRNKKWVPEIIAAAKNTPTFFAVGAAHLGGENGVIVLLRKQGYTVEAVSN
ncbi:TraB/GumN family protein [Flavobacterium rhizosphaerae]|uniref:TraB/GumN family protein n=1 Tax=Flavobacterium rhizosphaerae TaxID=3163298 RepID=A0ABW8YZY1_9FLAO